MSLDAHDIEEGQAVSAPAQVDEPTTDVINQEQMPEPVTGQRVSVPVWQSLRRWLLPGEAERTEDDLRRLALLDETITRYPHSPSGYVLRGELHLQTGLIDQALQDFRQGLVLAENQLYTEKWGVVAQVMRDRAQEGLNQALRLRQNR